MSKLKDVFFKAGGFGLLKQYWRAGALWVAITQFCLLGRSMKALEILRLTVSLKTQQRLARKYSRILKRYHLNESQEHISSKKLWIFWWQGMENAPTLVHRCYESVNEYLYDWDIKLITKDNYQQFVNFPEFILNKYEKGIISTAHFSDLLRLELLIRYGGLWLDATVLCTSSIIPRSIINSDLFVFQAQKPGADGHATLLSNWLIYSKTNNILLEMTLHMLYDYWKKNDSLIDYFIFHHFFTIACNHYPEEAKKIPPFCNSIPHILQLHLFDQYDETYWDDLKRMVCFHKLTYKLDSKKCMAKGTYYDMIINIK